MPNLIFLGGVFVECQRDFIYNNSEGVIQNAAHALQVKIVSGLEEASGGGVNVVNLPFIGAYPFRFARPYFPGTRKSLGKRSFIYGFGFINIFGIKHFARCVAAFYGLRQVGKCDRVDLVIYSAHVPFILAGLFYRLLNTKTRICLIIPDLPEYMGDGGWMYRLFKTVDTHIFRTCIRRIDFFVVLTEQMISRLRLPSSKSVVVEGIAVDSYSSESGSRDYLARRPRIVFYSGTLAKRYGILDLLEAFQSDELRLCELWICGEGDSRKAVEELAQVKSNVKYLGQLPHKRVLQIQTEATILVNPRPPNGDYTKFSFPSKILEYMTSGRPVVMYRLPGIPREYNGFYIAPEGIGPAALRSCLMEVAQRDEGELNELGKRARDFVLSEKSALIQAKKILSLFL